jgi:beta-lactam-binding protein with PASTA domain
MNQPPEDAWPTSDAPTAIAPPPPPPLAPVEPPPDRRIGAGMALAIGAILLVALGILIAWLLTHRSSDKGSVTTVVLRTQSTPATTSRVTTPSVVAKIAMPDVRGRSLADARSALSAAGLKTAVTQVTSTKPAGTVVDEAPKPGAKLPKGSTVTLSVAHAPTATGPTTTATTATTTAPTTTASAPPQPQNATMPDVTNQSEQSAAQALGRAGILASLVFVPAQDELGTVEQQAKPAGTTVPFHSHVQINISRGPNNNPLESVPSVIGKTLDQAVAAVQAAHLRLIFLKYPVTTRAQAGKIVQQWPLGGGQAPQNAQVLVYLGAFKP